MIRLIIDSTFGVNKEYAEEHGIKIVRLKMLLDGEMFEEGFEDSWNAFYDKMQHSRNFPTTSQPSPQDFTDAIEAIYREDRDAEIIILTISENLSGAINSARLAAQSFVEKKITVLDSGQATTCGRFMVEEVVCAIERGDVFDDVVRLISNLRTRLKIQFIPLTLDYLKRGGRIGALGAGLASILMIKPVFCFSDGELTLKKVIGYVRAVSEIVKNIPEKIKKIAVCYIYDDVKTETVVEKIRTRFPELTKIDKIAIEPIFGCHVGIGSVGIATLEE